jgi:hypothetical protein
MRKGITSFSYFPLSVANPQEAPALIKKLENDIDELKQSGQLPPGQAEQFDIQLETLQDNTLPDCEIIGLPGLRERDAKRRERFSLILRKMGNLTVMTNQ